MQPIKYPVYRPYLAGNLKAYVNECIDTSWISSKGRFISQFETSFAHYIGAPHAAAVCNGTVALHLALLACGIKPGDEVIVPALTYIASVNAIAYVGAKPIFVDSLPDTFQMDPEDVQRKISPRTKAILAVHLYGQPCEMDQLLPLCKAHSLFLIEDCAEAFGTTYKDTHVGTFGDVGTFSFFGNKTITTGEGGMVVSKNQEIHKRIQHLKGQGVSPDKCYWHDAIGYNYRMTNICAAIGLAQLEIADSILAKKRGIASLYSRLLENLPLSFHREIGNVRHSFWMCSILTRDASDRDPLRDYLFAQGVETRPFFYPVSYLPMYEEKKGLYPIAESLSARGINLPSYPELSSDDIHEIASIIRNYFAWKKDSSFSDAEDTAAALQTSI